jgi:hypothetical protein
VHPAPPANRYNRIVKRPFLAATALGFSILGLIGCGKNIDNKEAVRQGVVNYLSKRPDFLAMDVSVTSVAFRQDEATASVHLQAKGNSAPGAGMNMEYVLARKGSEWVVKGRAGSGNAHTGLPQGGSGSIGAMPQTGPGSASGSIGAMPQLPPGHPSAPGGGTPSGALPPGHPAVSPEQSAGRSK